jgi:AraC-like DNA-binding protein
MDISRTAHGFKLVSFLHPRNPAGSSFVPGRVVNSDQHLIHTEQGCGTIEIGSSRLPLAPSQVIFVPQGVEYRVIFQKQHPLVMLNFHYLLFGDRGSPIHARSLPTTFSPPNIAHILRLLKRLHEIWDSSDALARLTVTARLHVLAAAYFRDYSFATPAQESDREAERVKEKLADPNLTHFDANQIAKEVFLSASQLNRRFRIAFGLSPKKYWLKQRYLHALDRLQNSTQSIAQIAASLAFDDVNYFCRWFTKMNGVAPGRFRALMRARQF